MKTIFVAIFAVFAASTAVMADPLSFIGSAEYKFEAEALETKVGGLYEFDQFEISAMLIVQDDAVTDLAFTGVELGAAYTINPNIGVYTVVELDRDLGYTETTVGTAFRF
jgi:hypothetical protein